MNRTLFILGVVGLGSTLAMLASKETQQQNSAWSKNSACIRCHQEAAQSWRGSRHAQAATNSAFRDALKREPEKLHEFCLSCHAPDRTPGSSLASEQVLQGVSCVGCHLSAEGKVLAAVSVDSQETVKDAAPHALERSDRLTSSEACGACHEFRFPEERRNLSDARFAWMQRTFSEHADGNFQSEECIDCHMTRRRGYPDHSFPGSYDEQLVRHSLELQVRLIAPASLQLSISPRRVTHAVPTGDLFRRLRVELSITEQGRTVAHCVRFLSRHYSETERGQRIEISDDRVHLTSTEINCSVNPAAETAVYQGHYRVVYERVASLPFNNEATANVESSFVVAEGIISE